MNALTLLKGDHAAIDALFDKYRTTTGIWQKEELVIQLVKALSAHIEIENESVMAPALKLQPSLKNQVNKFLEAQTLIKTVIKGVGAPRPDCDAREREQRLDAKVQALQDRYRPCVAFEESELFPQMEALLDSNELEQLGKQVEKAKQSSVAQQTG